MASGQKCWMSAWHSFATQAALESLAEQPTESPLMCDSMHARMRPSPGFTPAHKDLRSTAQNRDIACGAAPTAAMEPDSSSAAPSANITDHFVMRPSLSVGFLSALPD